MLNAITLRDCIVGKTLHPITVGDCNKLNKNKYE